MKRGSFSKWRTLLGYTFYIRVGVAGGGGLESASSLPSVREVRLRKIQSEEVVHDTFIHNMDTLCMLIVIWSIDIWDDVHTLVRALNWFSVEPGWLFHPLYNPHSPLRAMECVWIFAHESVLTSALEI